MELQISLLGGFQVLRGSTILNGFISDKVRSLLAYLILEPRAHARPQLASLLWGDMPEKKAMASLRKALSNLNQLLGGYLHITRQSVAFDTSQPHWVDVLAFRELAQTFFRHQDLQAGEQAIALYQGDLLAGLHIHAAPEFETWLTVQREALHNILVELLFQLATYHHQRGNYPHTLQYIDRLLSQDPWLEAAHQLRMSALARMGRFSEALRQYQTCARILQQELGVKPSASTQALLKKIQRLRAQDPASIRSLPAQPTPFVGRTRELQELTYLINQAETRMITLIGLGGIGKTRLAIETAWRNRFLFVDGVTFISLRRLPLPQRLPQSLARALGISPSEVPSEKEIIQALRDQERLIILDSFEYLLDRFPDTAHEIIRLLDQVLREAPDITILTTSLVPLQSRWEQLYPLHGLPYPAFIDITTDQLAAFESVQIILNQLRRVDARYALTPQDWQAIARMTQLLDGIPLALELAASQWPERSLTDIADALQRQLTELPSQRPDLPPRHRSMTAALTYLWKNLPPKSQHVLRGLSILEPSFSAEAAQAIVPAQPGDLADLQARAILRPLPNHRYELPDPLRAFAAQHLTPDQETAIRQRHLAYYLHLTKEANQGLKEHGNLQDHVLQRLEQEEPNLRAALSFALTEHLDQQVVELALNLWPYWEMTGALRPGLTWLQRILAQVQDISPQQLAQLHSAAGILAWRLSQLDVAADHHQAALALLQQQDDPLGIAKTQANLALINMDLGQYQQAMSLYQQSLERFRQLEMQDQIALSLNNMSVLAMLTGQLGLAESYLEESLELYKEQDNPRGLAWVYGNLSNVMREKGDYAQALSYGQQAEALSRQTGDTYATAILQANRGFIHALQGQFPLAMAAYREAWETFMAVRSPADLAETLIRVAHIYTQLGAYEPSLTLLAQAQHLLTTHQLHLGLPEQQLWEQVVVRLQEQLDHDFDHLWQQAISNPLPLDQLSPFTWWDHHSTESP